MDLRVGELLEHLEPLNELTAERAIDDLGREMKVVHEHLTVQPLRRHRAEERASKDVVVDLVGAAQISPSDCAARFDFDRRDASVERWTR